MAESILDRIADRLSCFDCQVRRNGELKIFMGKPPSYRTTRPGKYIGEVDMDNWRIKSLTNGAPDCLKPLVGKSFDMRFLLYIAIREAFFVHELKREIKELFDL